MEYADEITEIYADIKGSPAFKDENIKDCVDMITDVVKDLIDSDTAIRPKEIAKAIIFQRSSGDDSTDKIAEKARRLIMTARGISKKRLD